jgi:transposase-like protein
MSALIEQACEDGARLSEACRVVGVSARTLQRWREDAELKGDGRKEAGARREPANKLSEQERRQILDIANDPEFAHRPPSQIVPILADQDRYIASESSFYRILREADQLAHRGRAKPPARRRPLPLQASAPNQLWSWDITYRVPSLWRHLGWCYQGLSMFGMQAVSPRMR